MVKFGDEAIGDAMSASRRDRAQQVMREEMEAGLHKPSLLDVVTTPHDEAQASVTSGGKPQHPQCEPTKLGDLMEEEFGVGLPDDADVSRMAHLLIEEHGKGLKLGIKQWGIIQRIVEHAVVFDPQEL